MLDNVATIFLASALVILLVTSGIALALIVRRDPFPVFVLFVMLAPVYGAFLTIGGVLLEELNNRERLRGHRESALALLARAAESHPDSVALQRLTRSVRRQAAYTLRLAAGGLTFEPNERVGAALDLTRTAVTYTPTSSRLGVMRNAIRAGLSFALDPRTSLYLDYSHARFAALGSVQDRANYAVVAVTRNIHSVDRWALDVGYQGQIRSHSNTGTYFGYYNPDFNQSHTTLINVRVTPAEPVSLALRTRLGVQVRDAGESVELGSSFRPSVTIRPAPRVAVTFAYSRSDTQDRFDQPYETDYFSIVTNWGF